MKEKPPDALQEMKRLAEALFKELPGQKKFLWRTKEKTDHAKRKILREADHFRNVQISHRTHQNTERGSQHQY